MQDKLDFEADDDSNANNFSFILGAADFSAEEESWAAFMELGIPLGDMFELQLAGRVEDYQEADQTTYDPKATIIARVLPDLTLRGSVGTSFRIGSLLQYYGQSTQLINIADPFSGAGLAFRPQIGLGNPDLQPEEATAWNVGLSYVPNEGFLAGFRIDLDYYDYDYEDLITLEGPADLVAQDTASRCPLGVNNVNVATPDLTRPACGFQGVGNPIISLGPGIPDQVIRDVNLSFLRVQPTYSNAQSLEVDGLDFTVGYEFETDGFGYFDTFVTGSWARTWDLTRGDGVVIDGVGSRNFGTTIGRSLPEYKVNFGFNWQLNRHAVNVLVRYTDSYDDNQPIQNPSANTFCLGSCLRAINANVGDFATGAGVTASSIDTEIDSWTVVDLQYTITLPAFSVVEEGTRLSIGGSNVFDEEPPEVNVDGGFDPFAHDPRGAVWYVRVMMNI
jgi:outer membrane receptor protein involved in Fe transport